MSVTKPVRKSLPLTPEDVADLELLRASAEQREELAALTGEVLDASVTEAKLLHAVYLAGLSAMRERVAARGYAEMATSYASAEQRRVHRRRRPEWAHEEA